MIKTSKYGIGELKELSSQKLADINLPRWKRDVYGFILEWIDDDNTIGVQTSGTTGKPRKFRVSKESMGISARKTLNFFKLNPGDSALLCLSPNYIAGKLMIVRALIGELDLVIEEPSGTPLEYIDGNIDFVAMVPMQVQKQIQINHEAFKKVKKLIIGGGEVLPSLKEELQGIPTEVWETYGMTETLTHIALKKLNGKGKLDWFIPLQGVTVSENGDNCLEVEVEGVTTGRLTTSDVVEFNKYGYFKIIGRADDVINTGGIKVFPSELEKKIGEWISQPFIISSVPDEILGEKVVLVIESDTFNVTELKTNLKNLEFYETPKDIFFIRQLSRTDTGKIVRREVRRMIS